MRGNVAIVAPVLACYDAISAAARDMFSALTRMRGVGVTLLTQRNDFADVPARTVRGAADLLIDPVFIGADLIIYHFGIYSPLFDAALVGNGRAPQVIAFHNITPAELVPEQHRPVIERSFRQLQALVNADEFWPVSDENAEELRRHGVTAERIHVIPLAVDEVSLSNLGRKQTDHAELLFVGRFVQSKGVLDLVRAVAVMRKRSIADFRLRLAGNLEWSDAAYLDTARREVEKLGLGDCIEFLGSVDDAQLADLYRSAHVFVMPSYHEGFCKPAVEALRAGCVPVLYSSSNLRYIANGLCKSVPSANIEALASALAEAVEEIHSVAASPHTAKLRLDRGDLSLEEFAASAREHVRQFESVNVGRELRFAAARLLHRAASGTTPRAQELTRRTGVTNTFVTVLPGRDVRRTRRATLNRLPDMSDWRVGSRFVEILKELRESPIIHRKAWEYGLCIDGIEQFGLVSPQAHALAVGAGYERPLFYFANRIERMIATDLYNNPDHEGQPDMLTTPWEYAPFEYRRERLEVMRMPGDDLDFPSESFDFLFCLSSIEHFGSRATQYKSLQEMKRVLRPGGVACVITELILEGDAHHEYFLPDELDQMFLRDPSFPLVGGELSWEIAEESISLALDTESSEDLTASPHLVLDDGQRRWTSASMFLQKQ